VTRLGKIVPAGAQFELAEAFRFLGTGPSHRELGMAADLLHSSGLDDLDYDEDLIAIAQENGSSAIDALDLVVVFHHGVAELTRGPRHVRETP
jgi:hypothetical protein